VEAEFDDSHDSIVEFLVAGPLAEYEGHLVDDVLDQYPLILGF
jgi:hypothetical protein